MWSPPCQLVECPTVRSPPPPRPPVEVKKPVLIL